MSSTTEGQSRGSRRRWAACTAVALLGVLAIVGCKKGDAATGDLPVAMDEAKQIFAQRCVTCHGDRGKGDGPGAAALNPKPRAFGDAAWQGQISDEQIKKTVLAGGAAVGKSPLMPGNPDLKGKDAVLNGLVKVIRAFKK